MFTRNVCKHPASQWACCQPWQHRALCTLALPVAQLTEMALGPAMVRWICEGSLPVVLSAAMPVVRGRKSVADLRDVSHGCVYGACTRHHKAPFQLQGRKMTPNDTEDAFQALCDCESCHRGLHTETSQYSAIITVFSFGLKM